MVLLISTDAETQRRSRLAPDINEITSYVCSILCSEDDHPTRPVKRVAWFDQDWL